jgi:hypothetical protein
MSEIPRDLDVTTIADQLGLRRRGRRFACPACGVEAHHGRGPIYPTSGGKGWCCSACSRTGDALTLIGWAVASNGRPRGAEFRAVLAWLQERRHVELLEYDRQTRKPRAPIDEIAALLRSSTRPHLDDAARAFLRARHINPETAPAGVLSSSSPSFTWWPSTWSRLFPLVVPAFTGAGRLAGVHARALSSEAPRKSTWPRGVDCSGLLFADPVLARGMLRGERVPSLQGVLICEGITDYLTAASQRLSGIGVLGIESGSAQALRVVPWPDGVRIYVATDPDAAGDRYSDAIAAALGTRIARPLPLRRLAA